MTQKIKTSIPERFFEGYPYLMIRITDRLFHINLLSKTIGTRFSAENLMMLAQVQADANKFDTCLVLDENAGVYFSPGAEPHLSKQIPTGGPFTTDRLRLSVDQPETEDLLRRRKELDAFIGIDSSGGRYLTGDFRKGGRKANPEELLCLRGVQENGLPKGIIVCPECGDYRGECLDPSIEPQGFVVKVSCYCENDSLCAYCGEKRHERKPGSNNYDPKDGQIWHTPFFCGLSHKCLGT